MPVGRPPPPAQAMRFAMQDEGAAAARRYSDHPQACSTASEAALKLPPTSPLVPHLT